MRISTAVSAGFAVLPTFTGVSASFSPRGVFPRQANDPQTSLTLDPKVIASGFANDGQDVPAAGQVPSLTSTNNFINFCLTTPNLPITNGKQITTGSCNPAPIGTIPSVDNMPSAKFTNPKNGDTIAANTAFTISMAIRGMETGNFVNAQENYFAAPQQLNKQGQIVGHSHVVVETLSSLTQTTATNPKQFAFFKGLNAAAVNGVLTADVTDGLPAGAYRLCSINTAANHQPAIAPIAQHGSLDDCVYFTASGNGAAAAAPPAASSAVSVTSAAATAAATAAAGGKGGKGGNKGGAAATTAVSVAATTTADAAAVTSAAATAVATTAAAVSTSAARGGRGGKGRVTSKAAANTAAAGSVTSAVVASQAAVTSAAGAKGGAASAVKSTKAAATAVAATTKAGAAATVPTAATAVTSAATSGRGRGRAQQTSNRVRSGRRSRRS